MTSFSLPLMSFLLRKEKHCMRNYIYSKVVISSNLKYKIQDFPLQVSSIPKGHYKKNYQPYMKSEFYIYLNFFINPIARVLTTIIYSFPYMYIPFFNSHRLTLKKNSTCRIIQQIPHSRQFSSL